VLVGDLVGPGPSRSILGPPDVPAWLASLDRIQRLGPRRLLPGHGPVPPDALTALDAQRRRLPAR
jgi:glyoxylase-like metal-dependent hydrolase (beta-lactamase superfamily II)